MNAIEVKNISKEFRDLKKEPGFKGSLKSLLSHEYKKVNALKNVNLKIEEGEFVGIVGPNGAGKSTLIKILTGVLTPTSGNVRVLGVCPYEDRKKNSRNIGVVFGQRSQLWWDLPVSDSFELLKTVYSVSDKDYKDRMRKFTSVLGIEKYLQKPVRKLSLGERMRCDMAASLIHNPPVLFLDEPTIGLDVVAKQKLREFLKEMNKKGTTIILTTHDTGDIEELCPRIVIVDKGKIIYDGQTSKIKDKVTTERAIVADFLEEPGKFNLPNGMKIKSREGDKIIFSVDTDRISVCDALKRVIMKHKVEDITVEEPSIEDIIRHIYKEGI
jgi:ABC-2 type transport system ATP-binding protein